MRAVEIVPLTLPVATYVAANAREIELREHAAMFDYDIYFTVAALAAAKSGFGYAALIDGNPVFAFGVVFDNSMPHIGQVWGIGTRHGWKAIPAITGFIRDTLIPAMKDAGVRRVEVRVLEDNTESIEWLTGRLGGELEARLRSFGRNGETFVLISWINEDVFHKSAGGSNSEDASASDRRAA